MSTDSKISKSPERHTFQAEQYIKRCEGNGEEPDEGYLNIYKSAKQQDEENMINPEWQKDNMEYDLRSTDWILKKARDSESYAQNIYAALCNNGFIKLAVIPILTEKEWSCSWRYAGGIVADMRQKGDYIDWYCSGIRDYGFDNDEETPKELTEEQKSRLAVFDKYVPEGKITQEIREDLQKLGWAVAPGGDWEKFE